MSDESDNLRDVTRRKAEFREQARDIVRNDRDTRKAGCAVDTGGTIARALERAYKLGLAHGENPAYEAAAPAPTDPDAALPWLMVPPRPRTAFETICRFDWLVLTPPLGLPSPEYRPMVAAKWACYRQHDDRLTYAETYGKATIAPLIKLGLLMEIQASDSRGDPVTLLLLTTKGKATWEAALATGAVR